ncbi:SRPBCC family protein [Cellulomonas dongxiuzhuiae]|uniref:SRPBCC family protein n=1 Tax=Cellulomonas dongxiuzhuiae TaxID=2819979 RepID=A0ABX8GJV4_9CELL|nr:SRPBCC family protein [Cellulomonas dongxiuzhuiae]MBO3089317.1 SRPBCC family protein [Cellulomonas dongxiuzhuiae]MBO3094897.1 SRPBCC family protein [Cellulomonas dongxiuzhuiae]QWC15926.1 SRPBCC family protein [Cellulomonas dongxiuzhuiae]
MATIDETIDVDVPVRTAYDQWTQFEEFPHFMDGVEEIKQISDTLTRWTTSIAGIDREFDAAILEQQPDVVVAWASVDGTTHAGRVTFEPLGPTSTRITTHIEWQPEGFREKVGAAIGADDRQVKKDLHRFKEFIEGRRTETGAWRGTVHGGHPTD